MPKVLVIDDSRTVHNFLRTYLSRAQPAFEVESAMDGQEAVDRFRASGGASPPDLIFLDWEMPRLNGPDTFARLKDLGVPSRIIMLTTKNEPADIARMLDAGVDEYVLKPFTADIIFEKVGAVLGMDVVSHGA